MRFLRERPYLVIVFMVMAIFLFSANRAWFHHRANPDGTYFVEAFPKNIPFMWQYDKDTRLHIGTTALFPHFYKSYPQLLSRPTTHLFSHIAGNGILLLTTPLFGQQLDTFLNQKSGAADQVRKRMSILGMNKTSPAELLKPLVSACLGQIFTKVILFILAGCLMFELLKRYTDQTVAIFAVAMLFFSSYAMNSIGTYHTYEYEILTPIIVIYLFHKLCESYSLKRNILFSLIVGCLMMAKANYASYIAVILYAGIFIKPRAMVLTGILVSVIIHLLPWLAWTAFIETNGMPVIGFLSKPHPQALALHPVDIILRKILSMDLVSVTKVDGSHSQPGKDFFDNVFHLGFLQIVQIIKNNISNSIGELGTMSGLLAAYGVCLFKHRSKHQILYFIAIFFFSTWLQAFFAFPYGPKSRALYDVNFLVYGLASFTIVYLVRRYLDSIKKGVLLLFLLAYISSNILNFVSLPWVHPFEQAKGVTNSSP